VWIVVFDDELDIDALDAFHSKPDGESPECFCGDVCKMEVSGDYKTLWQRYWMCDNLANDPRSQTTITLSTYNTCTYKYVYYSKSSICYVAACSPSV
jgi:hypothetical protein